MQRKFLDTAGLCGKKVNLEALGEKKSYEKLWSASQSSLMFKNWADDVHVSG